MTTYQLVIEGELSDRFAAAFGDMQLEHRLGETAFVGEIADQAQLQRLLARIADLGLAVRSYGPVKPAGGPYDGEDTSAGGATVNSDPTQSRE